MHLVSFYLGTFPQSSFVLYDIDIFEEYRSAIFYIYIYNFSFCVALCLLIITFRFCILWGSLHQEVHVFCPSLVMLVLITSEGVTSLLYSYCFFPCMSGHTLTLCTHTLLFSKIFTYNLASIDDACPNHFLLC